MQSPSQYILEGLLTALQAKQMSTGALAKQIGKSKKEIKAILSGLTPLTVDDLSSIGSALNLQDADLQRFMQIPDDIEQTNRSVDNEGFSLSGETVEKNEEVWVPNPVGTHSMQVFKLGFALGCNLFFVANTVDLQDSGIPESVLKQYGDKLPIRLDSDFFHHYKPEYFEDGLEIRLSFDAVYTCFFPWHVFEQITFFVADDQTPVPRSSKGPTLRIVD
jgi:hypothetical protein